MFASGMRAAGGQSAGASSAALGVASSATTGPNIQALNSTSLDTAAPDTRSPNSTAASSNTAHDPGPGAALRVVTEAEDSRRHSAHHAEPVGRPPAWWPKYQLGLVLVDLVAASVAVLISFLARFGSGLGGSLDLVVAVLLPLAWIGVVALNRGYENRFVGVGSAEFQRIFHAFLHLTAAVAIISYALRAEVARGFILMALPLALGLDLLSRFTARKWLHRQRTAGRAMTSVLVVGDADAIADFTVMVRRDRYAGMQVVGACVPQELALDSHTLETLDELDVPLLGDVDSVRAAVQRASANTVAVTSSASIGSEKLRWISWQLEGSATDLVVAPGLTEVAGPRLHIQPVAGLPLLHVMEPDFSGFRRVLKNGFDRAVAAIALFLLAPALIGLALAIRLTSSGPAFFRQERVGRDGKTFTMIKFRSMYVDAEERLAALQSENKHGDGVLFKMRDDPRVTKVGRLLRKYSLDELPQLINVVNGTMSLVGPRPPLPREVARYAVHVHRRLLVKPGLTGLWQVSGRSDLNWDESVRLDLRYVENWSIAGDLQILWKTMFAVVKGTGAY
jgi:exopolysaccharide biosynthesis polyprenyl glycosylphosphotransferase